MLNKAWIVALVFSAAEAIRKPEDDCCLIYESTDFTGTVNEYCHNWQEESYHDIWYMPNIHTMFCGKNVYWWMWRDRVEFIFELEPYLEYVGFGGYRASSTNLAGGWDFQHMGIYPFQPESEEEDVGFSAVMTFESADCQGANTILNLEYGWNSETDFQQSFNSFMIPTKTEVQVYSDANWSNEAGYYVGEYKNDQGEMYCNTVSGGSVTAYRKDPDVVEAGWVEAKWVKIGSGYSFSHSVSTSATNSQGETMSQSESQSFSETMSLGLSVQGISAGYSATNSLTNSLSNSISSQLSSGKTVTVTQSCIPGEMSSLWQWVAEDNNGNVVETNSYMCRFGDGIFSKPPKCPPPACYDSICEVCDPEMIVPIEEVDPEESVWLATSIPESISQHKKARHGAAYGTIAALSAAALGAAYCYSKKRSGVEKDDYVRAPLL